MVITIIDNAPFHPAERITELLQNAGFNVLFLPRYSPRDNKIEHRWFPIKNATRKILATYADINSALAAVINVTRPHNLPKNTSFNNPGKG